MGLFDRFKGGSKPAKKEGGGGGKPSPVARWAEVAGNKRAQNYDRQEAIDELEELCAPPPKPDPERAEEQDRIRAEAVTALLKRFTFTIDPSITDQTEKEKAFAATLKAGRLALEPIRVFATKAESLSWPMRIVRALVEEEEFVGELLGMLEPWDTEYAKFFDPKLQLLVELESHKDARIREAVEPFLADVNETIRFHAAATTLAQEDETALLPLLHALDGEESFRVKNKIVDGISSRGWIIPEDEREATRKNLPPGASVDGEGRLSKRQV
jgi:hypothetical protein